MGSNLQRVMGELTQLTLAEQWKLLGYLMTQLQSRVDWTIELQPEGGSMVGSAGIDALIEETRGSWGHQSIEAIDAELAQQRQISWGEQDVSL